MENCNNPLVKIVMIVVILVIGFIIYKVIDKINKYYCNKNK
jgi:hypothetical protein